MDTLLTANADSVVDVLPTDRVYGTVEALRAIMPYANIRSASFELNRENIIHNEIYSYGSGLNREERRKIKDPKIKNIKLSDFL